MSCQHLDFLHPHVEYKVYSGNVDYRKLISQSTWIAEIDILAVWGIEVF
jgi:hypothetical protein